MIHVPVQGILVRISNHKPAWPADRFSLLEKVQANSRVGAYNKPARNVMDTFGRVFILLVLRTTDEFRT